MKWFLNPDEVGFSYNASSGGGTFERRTKITARRLCLQHLPTKIRVEKEIPPGHYSKKEMQKLTEELKKQLFIELEQKVAKHLRIPGR
jgi:hypothetical protein